MPMTQLSEILESARDTIFQVKFTRQHDAEEIAAKLSKFSGKDFKSDAKTNEITKELLAGVPMTISARLITYDNHLDESIVEDLEAKREVAVDHRTIQEIILRNVRYQLGKKATEVKPPKDTKEKWEFKNLKIGDWFSESQYY